METYHFYAWVANHFLKQIPPKRPVVLLIDGHLSHIDYHTTRLCKENDVLLFKLPAHTSHVMQPADRGFFNVFKGKWKNACTRFMFQNPGVVVTKRSFSRLFVEAFDQTARPDVIKSSFRCSGIWPVNRHAIDPAMFAPSKTFEKPDAPTLDAPTPDAPTTDAPTTDAPTPEVPTPQHTSTPIKKAEIHPVLKTLEQLETNAGATKVRIFEMRLGMKLKMMHFTEPGKF